MICCNEDEDVGNQPVEPTEPPSAGLIWVFPMTLRWHQPRKHRIAKTGTRATSAALAIWWLSGGGRSMAKSEPVQNSPQQPILQTSMQTQINVGGAQSGPSYDSDQLDIPAFLRR